MGEHQQYETGIFYDRHDAEEAVELLHELGYRDDEISIAMSDKTQAREFAEKTGSKAAEGLATGGVVGGALGGIYAGFMATGAIITLATGGLAGPVILGPLAAILAGVGAGSVVGGVIGGLIGAGIPEHRARELEAGVEKGGIVIAVTPRDDSDERLGEVLRSNERMVRTETGEIEPTEAAMSDMPPRRTIP